MCGIAGLFGKTFHENDLGRMLTVQGHRGPDATGVWSDAENGIWIGHNRLSIIDLSENGRQPMQSASGRFIGAFNGEIYNYVELRRELEGEFTFRSASDTEVLLAAFEKWGLDCLDRLIGMFAIVIWDKDTQACYAIRDRFGVKPLNYHTKSNGDLMLASEIKTLHAAGLEAQPDSGVWAEYLATGFSDSGESTFWAGVKKLLPGHYIIWNRGKTEIKQWYDVASRVGDEIDDRDEDEVAEQYLALMKDSVKLRFRSDVPVGISLSGGLDSSLLLGLIHSIQGDDSDVSAFTFATGNEDYDELPWVTKMLDHTNHRLNVCMFRAEDVPTLAESVQFHQDEPFGGIPTLAYSRVFKEAKERGITVILDGNGMDEQWAGYDYYSRLTSTRTAAPIVQGSSDSPVRPNCLTSDLRSLSQPRTTNSPFAADLRNVQYRDLTATKIPRAMRFNDRISMMYSRELREPFLDHRLIELALSQPDERKVNESGGKVMLRKVARKLVPDSLALAPKRPVQTPQREWLRTELRDWARDTIRLGLAGFGGQWLDRVAVFQEIERFERGESDNSFYIWQWISLGLMASSMTERSQAANSIN